MRRGRVLAGVALLTALALTHCSESSLPSTPSADPATFGVTAAPLDLPSLRGQRVEVVGPWAGGPERDAFGRVLAAFEAATGAVVGYSPGGNARARSLAADGTPPDVAVLDGPSDVAELARAGAVRPLPAAAAAAIRRYYPPVWTSLSSVAGRPSAVWFRVSDSSTMWYRPDALAAAGVRPPTDWDSFTDDVVALQGASITPLAVGGRDPATVVEWFENAYLQRAGASDYDLLVRHQIPWTDPSVVTTLTMLSDLWGPGGRLAGDPAAMSRVESVQAVFGSGARGSGPGGSGPGGSDPGGAGRAAIVAGGDAVGPIVTADTPARPGIEARTFPFPMVNHAPAAVVGHGDAAVVMRDTPGARALVTYLADPSSATIWARLGGFLSPNRAVAPASYPDEPTRAMARQVTGAAVFRFDLGDLLPAAFGATDGQGLRRELAGFPRNPYEIFATAQALERDASEAGRQ